jgi:acetaldehyde dehydrogenase (acetylating)
VFVERTADVEKAARYILVGECFDDRTMCASEQSVVVDAPVEEAVRRQFRAQAGYFLST